MRCRKRNTYATGLFKEALFRSSSGVKSKFEQLMQGQSIHVKIDRYLSFDMLEKDETSLWSLLLFAGYLKSEISSLRPGSDLYDCQVSIPNDEIFRLYNRFFEEWLSGKFSTEDQYDSFLNHLVAGNVPLFMRSLGDYLLQSVSVSVHVCGLSSNLNKSLDTKIRQNSAINALFIV